MENFLRVNFGSLLCPIFGLVVLKEKVMVDPQNIKVVNNLASPTLVSDVHNFFGLVSYYRRFVKWFFPSLLICLV